MNKILIACMFMLALQGCKKSGSGAAEAPGNLTPEYTTYTIPVNSHYSDKSSYAPFSKSEVLFKAKFDSSAIYQSVTPVNQFDVNKLYGFSEGGDHHLNSARIGWAWNKNALRLYGYVYSNGAREIKEITTINIGEEINCSVKVAGSQYLFSVNNTTASLPRALSGNVVPGYTLYPYFGGDETAPHRITIQLMLLN